MTGVRQLELAISTRSTAALRDERCVWERVVRVVIAPAQPRRRRRRVDVPPVFLCVLAVVPFRACEAEYPLLEDGITSVPEGEREAEALLHVAHAGEAVFAPAIGARARVVVGEGVPRASVCAVVLPDRTPGALAHVGPERPPASGLVRGPFGYACPLGVHGCGSGGRCDGAL